MLVSGFFVGRASADGPDPVVTVTYTDDDAATPYIPVTFLGETYSFLIDTGSTFTYINDEVFKQLEENGTLIPIMRTTVYLADGTAKPTTVYLSAEPFSVAGCNYVPKQAIWIAYDGDVENIVGQSLLRTMAMYQFDTSEKTFKFICPSLLGHSEEVEPEKVEAGN